MSGAVVVLVVGATVVVVVVLVVVVVVLVVVVLVVVVLVVVDAEVVPVGPALVGEAAIDAVATSAADESDPHAAAVRAIAAASNVVRITETTVPDRCGATLAPMSAVTVRLLLGVTITIASASIGAACGADGPTTTLGRGEAIYGANCAQCHGADLAGTDRGPSLLEPMYGPDQLSDAEVADAIRNGVDEEFWEFGPMPANGAITDTQIEAIIAFVRAEQTGASAN
jgi:mono/diheme cytochrome c family protein